jgi:hypothetical protein
LKCTSVSRAHIKTAWFAKLKTFLYNIDFTPDLMGQILYNMIVSSCTYEPAPALPSPTGLLKRACSEQASIGWEHLLSGRLTHTWGTILANHFHQRNTSDIDITALTWGRKFVRLMFELVLQLWNQRNEDGHFSSRIHDSKLTRDRLMANIEAMQSSNPDIQPHDHVFIYKSIDKLQTYSLSNLQAWYRMAKNILAANKKRIGGAKKRISGAYDPDNPPLGRSRR